MVIWRRCILSKPRLGAGLGQFSRNIGEGGDSGDWRIASQTLLLGISFCPVLRYREVQYSISPATRRACARVEVM